MSIFAMLPSMRCTFLQQKLKPWQMTLLVGLFLFWGLRIYEHACLFQPDLTYFPHQPLAALDHRPLKAIVQDVSIATEDGVLLNAWFMPPQPGKPTVVFAHGNGGNIGDRVNIMEPFTQVGYGFLAFDYRGYGKSTGHPSEAGLYRDMLAASHYLQTVRHIPSSHQIAMGESLGSAVAVHTASIVPFRALIIFSSLTSAPEVAEHLRKTNQLGWLGILPLSSIMENHFNSLSLMSKIHCPVLIIHGTADALMPLSMPQALYDRASQAPFRQLILIPDAGHNDVFFRGANRIMAAISHMLDVTGSEIR